MSTAPTRVRAGWLCALLALITSCDRQHPKKAAEIQAPVVSIVTATQEKTSSSNGFGNDSGYAWADTPKGKFECRCDASTQHLQVLKLGGRIIFQENSSPGGIIETKTLSAGIVQQNTGVPTILSNRKGLVVVVRDTQAPHFGIQGYAVINFNSENPSSTILGEGQRPKDDEIADEKRILWSENGLTLRYFGYKLSETGGDVNSPNPAFHEIQFDIRTGVARQAR